MTESNEGLPSSGWSRVGVGCVTFVAGFFSGGMIGVLVSRIVAGITKAPKCEGIPTCDWYVYAIVGALLGAVTLPAVSFWRLRNRN